MATEFAGVVGMGALTSPTSSTYSIRLSSTESLGKGAAVQLCSCAAMQLGSRRKRGAKPCDSECGMG